ncbi:MAG: protein phosphatase 2C domain-containing protein [Zoogloea sp.]|uniref:PP2C family protein-serine/threonine phosphatase n=1 Tax=Zoogloea sp. TaxID=49181 RepID=UPI002631BDF5|nr:protein phosphatase 2C domain-containing protein [Zoogloea sp.]MDD2988677.1 protein phosphatase 2C domain-containing protein [Zoogloea sp.]
MLNPTFSSLADPETTSAKKRYQAEACVAKHTGDRTEQQDRAAVFAHPSRKGTLMAVLADGMGGHSGGAMAAEQVILKARQNFESFAPASESAPDLLRSIIDEAHIVIKLTRFTSEQDPHSTAVVFMMQPDRADWAHCGDSRFYHFRSGALVSRSSDHSLVEELVRKGRLDSEGALRHPNRNVLLSCLGSEREPRVDVGHVSPLVGGDAFLLCSDGLWAYIGEEETGAILASQSPRDAASTLIELARQRARGGGDNISLAVVKLVEVPNRPRTDYPVLG